MKMLWAFIKYFFKSPSLFICPVKNALLELIDFEKELDKIRAINNERHDAVKQCIYCGTEWKEVIKGRVYNKYSICCLCNKKTYHEEDLIERLTSKHLKGGGDT